MMRRYSVYGVVVDSDTPPGLPESSQPGAADVVCRTGAASIFLDAAAQAQLDRRSDSWHRYAVLADGSTYVAWEDVGEFIVSADGARIDCRRKGGSSADAFAVYMLGQALSFALVQRGLEPLHATAVVVDDRAIAFLGGSGFGKSTLAASFIEAGGHLLTDDLLVLRRGADGYLALPGPPRIKLFPAVARRLLGRAPHRGPMNTGTDKVILPLDRSSRCEGAVAIDALYVLAAPCDVCRTAGVAVEALSPRDAFVELVKSTFNRRLVNATRLARQIDVMADIANAVPIHRLSYPRTIGTLAAVREAVLARLGPAMPAVDGVHA